MAKINRVLSIVLLLVIGSFCPAQNGSAPKPSIPYFSHLNYQQFVQVLKDQSPVVLDVRTEEEYKTGHLKGAVLIDFRNPEFEKNVNKLDKKKTYMLYCRSGNRSGQAMEIFKKNGFKKVYNQQGGVIDLNKNRHPLEIGADK